MEFSVENGQPRPRIEVQASAIAGETRYFISMTRPFGAGNKALPVRYRPSLSAIQQFKEAELTTSFGAAAANLRYHAIKSYEELLKYPSHVTAVDELARKINLYVDFLYTYTEFDSEHISSDDEVINWTAPDITADLSNAVWSLACGYHKACASSLRNAYELTAVALIFQIEEDTRPESGSYNKLFSDWDAGLADTPNWSRLLNHLPTYGQFKAFESASGIDVKALFYGHYKSLCAYTHSRSFDRAAGLATNTMNIGAGAPCFDIGLFDRFISLIGQTISLGAAIWLLAYPEMLTKRTSYYSTPVSEYGPLFIRGFGREAFTWVTGIA